MSSTSNNTSIFKISFETEFKQWFVSVLLMFAIFVMPIQAVNFLNNPKVDQVLSGRVAGITTDNSGRYLQVPVLNFQFDTSLREPGSIAVLFGVILVFIALTIILISFVNFRKREHKYS